MNELDWKIGDKYILFNCGAVFVYKVVEVKNKTVVSNLGFNDKKINMCRWTEEKQELINQIERHEKEITNLKSEIRKDSSVLTSDQEKKNE